MEVAWTDARAAAHAQVMTTMALQVEIAPRPLASVSEVRDRLAHPPPADELALRVTRVGESSGQIIAETLMSVATGTKEAFAVHLVLRAIASYSGSAFASARREGISSNEGVLDSGNRL